MQRLRLHAATAGGMGSIPRQRIGSHMPHDAAKKKKKENSDWKGESTLGPELSTYIKENMHKTI